MKVNKHALDAEVALQLGKSHRSVSRITTVFLDVAMRQLVEMNVVVLGSLVKLHIYKQRGHGVRIKQFRGGPTMTAKSMTKYFVSCYKGTKLTSAIQDRYGKQKMEIEMNNDDEGMSKYGVDEAGTAQEKKASAGCPNCGGKVEKHGNVLACAKCGTEPFEAKKE